MEEVRNFFEKEYPLIWQAAYVQGFEAEKSGLPRVCNLTDPKFFTGNTVLKCYLSAWEQGYDHYHLGM